MTPKDAAELRRVFTDIAEQFKIAGLPPEDLSLEQMTEALQAIGLPVDEGGVAELERRWREIQPMLLQAAVDPAVDAHMRAESVFQAAVDELGQRPLLEGLAAFSPGVRAIVATRFVEANVGNGGWVSVFVEGQGDLLPVAVEGYRTLGLAKHAQLVEAAQDLYRSVQGDLSDPRWDKLGDDWLAIDDRVADALQRPPDEHAELGRIAYIESNPAEFARYRDAAVE